MSIIKKNKYLIFSISFFLVANSGAVEDTYNGILYNFAFNQENIYKDHKYLLKALACSENIFPDETNEPLPIYEQHKLKEEIQKFENNCINRLYSEQKIALFRPGALYSKKVFASLVYSYAINKFLDRNSYGSGKFNSLFLNDLIGTIFELLEALKKRFITIPENSLGYLEEMFAINKCYIPRQLWGRITKEFMLARNDFYSRDKHVNFLEFTLALTTYKTKPEIRYKDNLSIEEIKQELNRRIDIFFTQYNEIDPQSLAYIKLDVSKFIDSLVNNNNKSPILKSRYIFLYGLHGIGKTHFVQKLSEDINELISNSVLYTDLVINSNAELEGKEETPGVFLKVLRNQLLQNKLGSIIVIDEATWINNRNMIDASKHVFNGNRSRLTTTYFGTEFEDTGISIKIPPMLIFITNNENINDPALESRFDIVNFPKPNQQSLINYAYMLANKSEIIKKTKCTVDLKSIENWIKNLDEIDKNFRYIQANIEAFILT